MLAACEGLDADLVLVEGLHHDEAFERYREADIVVDQLNAGWYGLFAIECMALGKPVVTFLHDEAVERTERELGTRVPIVRATKDDPSLAARAARRLRGGAPADRGRVACVRRAGPRPRARRRPPARSLRSAVMSSLGGQLKRLGKHSVIYGLGGLVSRILAVLLLPLYTRYLSPSDYGKVETLIALTTVIGIALSAGIGSAFFRFYFDSAEPAARRRVLRTSFWFIMGMATLGLVVGVALASEISQILFGTIQRRELVAASFVGLWAGMNWTQLTNLFRVEERSAAFVSASIANILVTVGATLILVVALDKGPIGVIVGNFTGTLAVYAVLVLYRREQLGLEFDRKLLRRDEHVRAPARPERALPVGDELLRPHLPREARRHARGRSLLGRGAHRVGARAPAHRVPPRMAGVRVLDRGRVRQHAGRTRTS